MLKNFQVPERTQVQRVSFKVNHKVFGLNLKQEDRAIESSRNKVRNNVKDARWTFKNNHGNSEQLLKPLNLSIILYVQYRES